LPPHPHVITFLQSPYYLLPKCPFITLTPQAKTLTGNISLWTSIVRPTLLGGTDRPFVIYFMSPSNDALKEMGQLAAEGKMIVDLDGGKAMGWDEESMHKCYERMMSGKAQGKIVVEVPQ
jgi:NADPH:quinone reductase-like Zn-dependent oxidoreductase